MAATIDAPEQVEGQQDFEGGEVQHFVPLDELVVEGPVQLSTFDVGGKRPMSGVLKLPGVKLALEDGTGFRKGTVIRGTFEAVIDDVRQVDKRDKKTSLVITTEQVHGATITDIRVDS